MDDSLHLYIAILNCFSMHLNINDTFQSNISTSLCS